MADTKISALTDGATADATDRLPAARSPFGATDNRYITPAYLATYLRGLANTWAQSQTFDQAILSNIAGATTPALKMPAENTGFGFTSGAARVVAANVLCASFTNSYLQATTGRLIIGADAELHRDEANILALRRGTTAQAQRIYNTYTDASNYERASFTWSGNEFFIDTAAAGTGTQRNLNLTGAALYLRTGASSRWTVSSGGHLLASTDNTYDVGGSSNRPRDVWAARQVFTPILSAIAASGPIKLTDGSGTDFSRLQFGGTTSSFPALKRSSTEIQVKLADDSADAPFRCGSLTSQGQIVNLSSGAQGDVLIRNATEWARLAPGTSGQYLKTLGAGANPVWDTPAGGGSPGGADTQIQFNDAGAFGGDTDFTYNKTTDTLSLPAAGTFQLGTDTKLSRDAANILAQRNGTTAQQFNLYGTFTDSTNYRRGELLVDGSNNLVLHGTGAGTGAGGLNMVVGTVGTSTSLTFKTAGSNRWRVEQTGHLTAITDNTHDIGASGATRPRNIYAAGNVTTGGFVSSGGNVSTGTGSYLTFGNRGGLTAPSDGVLTLVDQPATSFGRLQFGGTSSSFPSLKRSSTTLQGRLADDSDFCTMQGKLQVHANAVAETPTPTHTIVLYDAAGQAYRVPCVV